MPDLIVLCPGALLAPAAEATGPLPALLRRAALLEHASDDALAPFELPHEAWLRQRLALAPQWSIEAASAYLDEVAIDPDQPVLRATPVHLHVGMDSLVLTDPALLELTADDAQALANSLSPLLAELGGSLLTPAPDRWYLAGTGARAATRALPAGPLRSWRMVVGRATDAYSPQGVDARPWRKLMNEVQMSWFEHPVNRRREAAGLPAVNSLWFDGHAPVSAAPAFATWITDDAALRGLARAAGAHWRPLAEAAEALGVRAPGADARGAVEVARRSAASASASAASVALPDDVLLVSDAWHASERERSPDRWQAAWADFDALLARLGARNGPPAGFSALQLVLCGERRRVALRIARASRWQVWRRNDVGAWLETPR